MSDSEQPEVPETAPIAEKDKTEGEVEGTESELPKRKRLRPVSRETKFVKFRAMNCFEDVHQKILDGWTPMELAKYIQDDQQEYTDITRDSMVAVINDYRSSLPPAELVERRMPAFFNRALEKLDQGVDEVKELEWVAKLQKKRLKIDNALEKKINKLMPSMTQEVRVMIEALRALADVKMDLGVSKRHLGELNVDTTLVANVVNHYGKASIAKVMANPESRQKVMGAAEAFLALAAAEAGTDDTEDAVIDVEPSDVAVTAPTLDSSEPSGDPK